MAGPLHGLRVVELAGIGPGPHAAMILGDLGADVVRIERPGGGGGVPKGSRPDEMLRNRRSVAADLKTDEGRELVLRTDRQGRRADRGLPPRRHRATWPGARRLCQGQRAADLRPHDGLGPDRPAQPTGRPRHQLHLAQRPAALHRPRRRTPGPAVEPDRRFRRRLNVSDRRNPGRAVGAADLGQGPGRRCRDDRRLQRADADDVGHARRRHVERRARHQHPRRRRARTTTPTPAPTAATSRSVPSSRSSTPRC